MISSYLTEPGFWILVGLPLTGLIQLVGTLASRGQFVHLFNEASSMSEHLDKTGRTRLAEAIELHADIFHIVIVGPCRAIWKAATAPVRLWRVRGRDFQAHLDAIIGEEESQSDGDLREIEILASKAFLISRPFVLIWCIIWVAPLLLVSAPFLLSASGVFSKTVDAVAELIVKSLIVGPSRRPHVSRAA